MRRLWAAGAAVSMFLVIGGVPALAPVAQAQDDRGGTTTRADGWTATVLPQTIGTTMAVGVAVGPSSMVAVGQRACTQGRRETSRCWGPVWTSPDGITWEAVDPRTSGLDLGLTRATAHQAAELVTTDDPGEQQNDRQACKIGQAQLQHAACMTISKTCQQEGWAGWPARILLLDCLGEHDEPKAQPRREEQGQEDTDQRQNAHHHKACPVGHERQDPDQRLAMKQPNAIDEPCLACTAGHLTGLLLHLHGNWASCGSGCDREPSMASK